MQTLTPQSGSPRRAKKNGDYQLADDRRNELAAAGIELEDSREGTRWRRL